MLFPKGITPHQASGHPFLSQEQCCSHSRLLLSSSISSFFSQEELLFFHWSSLTSVQLVNVSALVLLIGLSFLISPLLLIIFFLCLLTFSYLIFLLLLLFFCLWVLVYANFPGGNLSLAPWLRSFIPVFFVLSFLKYIHVEKIYRILLVDLELFKIYIKIIYKSDVFFYFEYLF
jgi:hypothetical protein